MRVLAIACAVVVIAILAVRSTFSDSSLVVGSQRVAEATTAAAPPEQEGQHAAAAERSIAHDGTLPTWLETLLYGPAGGAAGYMDIVAAIREGRAGRIESLTALLRELDADNRERARLLNVERPLALLLGPDLPEPGLIAAKDAYLALAPSTHRHAELMAGVREWPIDEATRTRILALLDRLRAATTHAERVAAIEALLRLGAIATRTLAVDLVTRCAKDGGGTMPFVHALLDASTEPAVLDLVLHEAAATQVSRGAEQASVVVNGIGVGIRTWLANELGHTTDDQRRAQLQSTLMGLAGQATVEQALGVGVTTAIALGGSTQDDPGVAAFLANASRSWPTLAANTALVNLGYATDPQSFLAYVPWPLTPPEDSPSMLRHADYITGLGVALSRHRDQEAVVLPYILQTLRTWRTGRYEVLVSEDVLRLVESMDIRGAAAALQELRDANVPRLSNRAGEILQRWQ